MKEETITDQLLIRYALGQLSEDEQERVEERIFQDRQFFERLLVVEDELLDAYAAGRLTGDERERFERYFLKSKEDKERVGFARELAAYVSGKTPPKRSRWYGLLRADMFRSLVPLAAALLIAAGALWLVFQLIQMNDRLEEMRAERDVQEKRKQELEQQVAEAQGRYQQLAKELERERAQQEVEERTGLPSQAFSTGIVSFILRSGAVRDRSDTTRLVISVEAERVRLQPLFKTGDYQSYSAEIQTVEGRLLWERAGLKDRKRGDERVVTLLVPASLLSEGDYILILSGAASTGEKESVGEYYFRVDRK